jgi:hypothetical protein
VNGDGLADLIVGAPSSTAGAGRSYVVFGKTTGLAIELSAVGQGSGGFAINGQSAGDDSGVSVSAAGDVNGDGLADLIVGADNRNEGAGSSYVIFGATTGSFAPSKFDWVGGAGNDTFRDRSSGVLSGGAGSDTLYIDDSMIAALESGMGSGDNQDRLARIDGGSGTDTLKVSGNKLTMDLSRIANQAGGNPTGGSRLSSIEIIDLTGMNKTLKLSASDVFDMSEANVFQTTGRHQLMVKRDVTSDTLVFNDPGDWVDAGRQTIAGYNNEFTVWNNTHSLVTVFFEYTTAY